MAIIYELKNTVTCKKYVGQTIRSLDDRWNTHVYAAIGKSDLYIHRSIRKYGPNAFERSVLEKCLRDDLNDREVYWIDYLDTFHHGYNLTKGGDGVLGLRHTAQSNEKNRQAHIGLTQTKQTCKKRSDSMKRSKRVNRKRVRMIGDDNNITEFDSLSAAATAIGRSGCETLISRCCRGRTQKAYGYMWQYIDPQVKSSFRRKVVIRQVEQRDIDTNELIKTHDSLSAANRSVEKISPAIRACCHGKLHTAHGFRWNFKKENI